MSKFFFEVMVNPVIAPRGAVLPTLLWTAFLIKKSYSFFVKDHLIHKVEGIALGIFALDFASTVIARAYGERVTTTLTGKFINFLESSLFPP